MLLINAYLHTMEHEDFSSGFILTENKKILQVGNMEQCPEYSGEIIDLKGKHIYPGFIDAHTHMGICEDSLGFEGDDVNEDTDPITPHLRAIDAINSRDRSFKDALLAGITTVLVGPGSANPIGGQIAALKTDGICVDDMILRAPIAIKMALGENPKSVYSDKSQTPSTRMATAALIREELFKAKRYLSNLRKADDDEDLDKPDFDMKCEALIPALERKIQVHFHCHRADDIFTAIRIGEEFNLDYVIVHGSEGHLIADRLAEKNIRVLCGPILTDRSKPELRSLTTQGPSILEKAGVQLAIITDHPETPIQYLPLCAGIAKREGLSHNEALRAITINAAKICEIDSFVGSLKEGKDADMVIFDEDPLILSATPKMVIINGKIVKM